MTREEIEGLKNEIKKWKDSTKWLADKLTITLKEFEDWCTRMGHKSDPARIKAILARIEKLKMGE